MHSSAAIVRPATLEDLEVVVEFNKRIALETEDMRLEARTVTAGVRWGLEHPEACRYYVAQIGEDVAGQMMVTFEWSDWRNGWFWWIQSVYVDKRFRRTGVFQALYANVRNAARNRPDVRGLRLYVERDNADAMAAYQSVGMVFSGYQVYEEVW